MANVHPYLNFAGNTEEAFQFYSQAFNTKVNGVIRFRDVGGESMGITGADLDKIAHIDMSLPGGTLLMATDVLESLGQKLTVGNNFYIYIETESPDEARRLFQALGEGGTVEMELGRTEWAELYGALSDRFGVQWMVSYTGDVKFEVPQGA